MPTALNNIGVRVQISTGIVSGLLSGTVLHQYAGPTLAFGTAAGQVNICAIIDFTVSSGSPFTVDLTALNDAGGNPVTFGHLTHRLLENKSATAGQDMNVGGGTNGVAAAEPIPVQANGGVSIFANPNPGITIDGTHKIIQVAVAAGTGVSGRLTLLGRTT